MLARSHGSDGDVVALELFVVQLPTAAVFDHRAAVVVVFYDERAVPVRLRLRARYDVVVDSRTVGCVGAVRGAAGG